MLKLAIFKQIEIFSTLPAGADASIDARMGSPIPF
jgi:hypothetical protein